MRTSIVESKTTPVVHNAPESALMETESPFTLNNNCIVDQTDAYRVNEGRECIKLESMSSLAIQIANWQNSSETSLHSFAFAFGRENNRFRFCTAYIAKPAPCNGNIAPFCDQCRLREPIFRTRCPRIFFGIASIVCVAYHCKEASHEVHFVRHRESS